MRPLRHLAVVTDRFTLLSPAQQLLDRFLIGFARDGRFERPRPLVALFSRQDPDSQLIQARRSDFGLGVYPTAADAVRPADAVIVVGPDDGVASAEALLRSAWPAIPEGAPVFVYGRLATSPETARELMDFARSNRCPLSAGTALATTFRLPEVDLTPGTALREALIVVQGPFPSAELDALEGLLPLLEQRRGGERGVRHLRRLEGAQVWQAGDQVEWSWPLLAAALSRSQTPQGHPVQDGRTEDLVGLGLVRTLATRPRAWLFDHRDGLRSALLVLDGVVADVNFALRTASEQTVSAQLFRGPAPPQEHYSRLAAVLLDYFTSGKPPFPFERSLFEVKLLGAMGAASSSTLHGQH